MIPRIIHVFWSGERNVVVEACIARMRTVHPEWVVLRYDNFEEADLVEGFDTLSIQAKTDWLRLCLVEKHGGVWLDSTIICNRCIEESIDVSETRVVGYECPIVNGSLESWAFAARPNHPFITAWKEEFGSAITMGFDEYKVRTSHRLKGNTIYDHMPYLTMHGAFVLTASEYPNSVTMHHSLDEHHGPFFFTKKEWEDGNRYWAVGKLFLHDFNYPSLLKLTGETRDYMTISLSVLPVLPNSFVATRLHLSTTPQVKIMYSVVVLMLLAILLRAFRT